MANLLDPTEPEMKAMEAAQGAAGVPAEFRRFQEPVIVGRDYDMKWLRFECSMWKRSYEVALRAVAYLEKRVKRLERETNTAPMVFFYPDCDR